MKTKKSDLNALQLALKMERDGRNFFLEAKEKASHSLAKKTFQSLADWELEHMKIIERFHVSLKNRDKWESVQGLQLKKGEAIRAFKTIFEELREEIDRTVPADADDLETYRMAIGIEDKLASFYQKLAREAANEGAKLFYEFMVDQEREHHRILDNSLQLLENPAQWFEREEWTF